MFQVEQKLCEGTKNVLMWHIIVQHCRVCIVWSYVALYTLLWTCMVLLLPFMAITMCGFISIALCVLVWS